MMPNDTEATAPHDRTLTKQIGSWIGVVSAVVTVVLTVVNAYWSNRIRQVETDLEARQLEIQSQLEQQRIELDAGRERLERFTFAQRLLEDLVDDVEPARSLKINLVNLALTEEEAEDLWQGLRASQDETVSSLGTMAVRTRLARLVGQMDAATREERIGAVQRLIDDHATNPQAVEQALTMLEEPRVGTLSASGRINVMVFLQRTEPAAWNASTLRRADAALEAMRGRAAAGTAPIGEQTREILRGLEDHLDVVRGLV